MKYHVLIIFILLANVFFGQSGALKDAVRQGKNHENKFIVKFNEPVSEQKVAAWIKKNGYVPINVERRSIFKFGDTYTGVTYIEFMTKADSDALMARIMREANERERLALEKARREQEQNSEWSLGDIGKAIVAGAIFMGAAALAYDAVTSPSTGDNYSNNSSKNYSNGSSSSTYDPKNNFKDSNLKSKTNQNIQCILSDIEYDEIFIRCSAKVKDKRHKVKCANGSTQYYWYCPIYNSDLLCELKVGYHTANGAVWESNHFLSTNKDEALKKLCECNK